MPGNYTPRMPKKRPRNAMGRPPLPPDQVRERLTVRLQRGTLAKIAELAGPLTVREWVERLVETATGTGRSDS